MRSGALALLLVTTAQSVLALRVPTRAPLRMSVASDSTIAAAAATKAKAAASEPFAVAEVEGVVASLQAVAASSDAVDWPALRELLGRAAHMSHKDWDRTDRAAAELASLLGDPDSAGFRAIFERVLEDGNWDGAAKAGAAREEDDRPWAVLVTGVNGIRKTSSVYQEWFPRALKAALGDSYDGAAEGLPCGGNSFFRQLDYMIATVAGEEFRALYGEDELGAYSARKDAIFARYRTLAEMLGAALLRAAQASPAPILPPCYPAALLP